MDGLTQEGAEPDASENIARAHVNQVGELRPPRAPLPGDVAPGLAGMGPIGLVEGLPERATNR